MWTTVACPLQPAAQVCFLGLSRACGQAVESAVHPFQAGSYRLSPSRGQGQCFPSEWTVLVPLRALLAGAKEMGPGRAELLKAGES